MEADELKSGGGGDCAEIVSIGFTQGQIGAARAKHALPEMGKRVGWRGRVDGNRGEVILRRRR